MTATYQSTDCEPETVEIPFRRTRINDDAQGDLSDAVFLLNFLFAGGENPAAPFAECGLDATADELSCEAFTGC